MTRVKQLNARPPRRRRLAPDAAQSEAIARLDDLARGLAASRGWFGGGGRTRGLYIWGKVGRGRCRLADGPVLEAVTLKEEKHVHFHDFMLETHLRISSGAS